MERPEAFRIIESLRLGIPPDGAVRHFTVGRKEEIEDLRRRSKRAVLGCCTSKRIMAVARLISYGCFASTA